MPDPTSYPNKSNNKEIENNGLFTCILCGKLMTKAALNYHLKSHDKDETSRCYICHKELRSCTIDSHMKKHKCAICEENVAFKSFHKCGEIRKYKCAKCSVTFTDKSLLSEHKKSGHKKSVHCKMCGEKFQYLSHLKQHFKNKPYQCDSCKKSFCIETALQRHQKTHKIAYECDKCLKVFADFAILNEHKLGHPGYVKCDICSFVVKGSALGNHKRVHNKYYRCEVCLEDFSTESKLSTHRNVRCLLLKDCFCLECGEKFSSRQFLKQHLLIHDTEKATTTHPVKTCSICSLRFTNVEAFQNHLFEHYKYYVAL